MSNETIRSLLSQLQAEIESVELDEETKEALQSFDSSLRASIEADEQAAIMKTGIQSDDEQTSLIDLAKQLEAGFEAKHPVAGNMVRELIDTLGRMGI